MEKNLEKLFSSVLVNWLRCLQIASSDEGSEDFRSCCSFTADLLEGILQMSGFDTDMKDYVTELALKGESV